MYDICDWFLFFSERDCEILQIMGAKKKFVILHWTAFTLLYLFDELAKSQLDLPKYLIFKFKSTIANTGSSFSAITINKITITQQYTSYYIIDLSIVWKCQIWIWTYNEAPWDQLQHTGSQRGRVPTQIF